VFLQVLGVGQLRVHDAVLMQVNPVVSNAIPAAERAWKHLFEVWQRALRRFGWGLAWGKQDWFQAVFGPHETSDAYDETATWCTHSTVGSEAPRPEGLPPQLPRANLGKKQAVPEPAT
jgi:hypothetical protein